MKLLINQVIDPLNQQEKEVVPDKALLQQIVKIDFSGGGREVDPYLDFFLALAICNTVVVSTATAQRERVSASVQKHRL